MAINFLKDRSIKYVGKDFQSFKQNLMEYTKAHNSGVFQDYNETAPGMALLEHSAYVGDVLAFYLDMQFQELQDTARQIENVHSFAKRLGYRPSGKRAARTVQSFMIEVPNSVVNGAYVPDDSFSPILRRGSQVLGPQGVIFETLEDVHFSASLPTPGTDSVRVVTGSQFDNSGLPTKFGIKKDVEVIAGETKTETFTLGNFQQFRSVQLSNPDVIEVLSVTDSDGNTWYEVEYLAQDTVFDITVNTDQDDDVVPYSLKLRTVPRRFVTDIDPTNSRTSLIFGSGDGLSFDDQLIPNIADLALPLPGRRTFTSVALDPQNFLKTRTLGLSPFNTTLTVTYRVGGGSQTNVPVGSIKTVVAANFDFNSTNLDAAKKSAVVQSIETFNFAKSDGGAPEESIAEIQANRAAYFAAQDRVVTREDFIARVLSLPSVFGKPDKVFVRRDNFNGNSVDVHVLTRDADNHLTVATPTLKKNIKTYVASKRMLTDGMNILDSDIVNLAIDFGIVVGAKINRTEVQAKCLSALKDYFDTDNMQIGQPIVITDVNRVIQSIFGVVSVYKLEFRNKFGIDGANSYSNTRFDVRAATQNQIIYCPENTIFEFKFPNVDIRGATK